MQCTVIGFSEIKGNAKASGNPFHMLLLSVLSPSTNANQPNFTKLSVGYEIMELPVDEPAKARFLGLNYPCNVELVTVIRPRGKGNESVVTGLKGDAQFIDLSRKAEPAKV